MTKKDFFEKLNAVLSKEEVLDIKKTCDMIDTYLQKNNEDANYQARYKLFNDSKNKFIEFKLNLGKHLDSLQYIDAILKRVFIKEQNIGAYYQETLITVDKWLKKDWPELPPKEQDELRLSITERVYHLVILSKIANEEILILKDRIVLKKITQFDTISFKNEKKEIGRLVSKQMIDLIRTEFTKYIESRRLLQATLPELKNKLKQFEKIPKKCLHYTIRSIAETLAEYDLLEEATTFNNYNLKNKKGVSLSLGNKVAEKIYNLLEDLDFNVAYYAGRRSPLNQGKDFDYFQPESKKEKIDYVKDRLINLPKIDVNQLLNDYQGLIL